jgi:hypothetical protein
MVKLEEKCWTTKGCKWDNKICKEIESDCPTFSDMYDCIRESCSWDPIQRSCGEPTSAKSAKLGDGQCRLVKLEEVCWSTKGCKWDNKKCKDMESDCPTFSDMYDCMRESCRWDPIQRSCGELTV